jgi:hypothetical protein
MNEYLMNQSVITFSNSTARGSAITTPVEGMITYLEDTQTYESWDGAAWVALITPASSGNAIINGAFDIWQRGTSTTATGYTAADRWLNVVVTNSTISRTTLAAGEVSTFAKRITTSNATNQVITRQALESNMANDLRGKTVTYSFYAKASANTNLEALLQGNTLADTTGGSFTTFTEGVLSASVTTSTQRFTKTLTIPADSSSAGISLAFVTSNSPNAGTLDIWGVQLEVGAVATPFRRNANSLQGELAACQRYYVRFVSGTDAYSQLSTYGPADGTTTAIIPISFPTTMRVQPTSVDFATLILADGFASLPAVSAVVLAGRSTNQLGVAQATSSGLTSGRHYCFRGNNSTASFIGFSAEL